MTTGPSSKLLSEKLAERRATQLGELEDVIQRQLSEHERNLQQLLSDARLTTEHAIHAQSYRLNTVLNDAAARQRQQIEAIEPRLAAAAAQAERLSRVGGLRSWTRPLAITAAVMFAVVGVAASGLALADRLIDSRLERLAVLQQEIQRAEQAPRLPQGVEIRTLGDGQVYLIGVDPRTAVVGTIDNGRTPVIRLTEESR